MSVVILKYNAGNVFSVKCALNRLGIESNVTDKPSEIRQASHVVFPGVGEAATAMHYLQSTGLDDVIKHLKQPVLGICIGMQLMCQYSEEGNTQCLGIFDVDVKRFDNSANKALKIPHMGWNNVRIQECETLLDKSLDDQFFYFVHSYYAPVNRFTIATTDYIVPFSAVMHKDNFYATQFHPEKSGLMGEQVLKRFLEL